MTQGVNGVSSAAANRNNRAVRAKEITVKSGENLTVIAKRFGMSPKEFMAWTGLKSSNLSGGQKIPIPTDTVPEGKGLFALAKKYGMTLDEFCKFNNISKDYKPAKGEIFYVKPSGTASARTQSSAAPKAKRPANAPAAGVKRQTALSPAAANKAKWGSEYTPEELGKQIYQKSCDYYGAVGKPDFDALINQINSKNASAVIKAYTQNPKNKKKESLINTITSEVSSNAEARKNAVMKVYDALAAEKSIPASYREAFKKELDEQFDKLFGMVNTKKLDAMINDIISGKIKPAASQKPAAKPAANAVKDNRNVKITKNEKTFTVSELQKGAIASAKTEAYKNFKEYCRANNIKYDQNLLDTAPLDRIPAPTIEGSSIVAKESEVLKPTTKPNGKVVILNPGHGGYSSRTGYFDPGSYSFIKKANGKYAPLLEYDKMAKYADSLAEKLRAQGYAVVITSAHAQTFSDQKSISNLVSELNSGKKNGTKYPKNNIMFISLHADSEPGKSGTGVCYDSGFEQDKNLAEVMTRTLNEEDWISASSSERNWDVPKKGLQVLHQTEDIPSVLVEVEYVNGSKSQNLDSSAYQNKFESKLIESINKYFGE